MYAMRHTVHTNGGTEVDKLGNILYNLAQKLIQIFTNFIQIGTTKTYNLLFILLVKWNPFTSPRRNCAKW